MRTTSALPRPAADAAPQSEFQLSTADFQRICRLIYDRAGIHLHEGKRAMVYSRLARRLRDNALPDFTTYLDSLERGSGPGNEAEWQAFVNCLTTNLTSFFREAHHFELLHEDLQRRRGKPVRLWCNAASTGEEPYSIAMTVHEALGPSAPVKLLATDIDTQVLATAGRAVYDADARGLTPERLKRHFLRGKGRNEGLIRVKPELSALVEFRPFNLMSPQWSVLGEPFDIIFCRNVMIYFDNPTQRRVLERMHAALKPGGLLFVGHSENFTDARDLVRLRGKTVYERI